jgi:hypothetical protein
MSLTFLRLDLAGRRPTGGGSILLNVDHIVRIHPSWPHGCTIVTTDDASLNVRASLDELRSQMVATNGRIVVKTIVQAEPEHKVDAARNAHADVADWGDTDDKLRAHYDGKGI